MARIGPCRRANRPHIHTKMSESGLEGFAGFAFDEQGYEIADGVALETGVLCGDGVVDDRARHIRKLGSEAIADGVDVLVFGGGSSHCLNDPLCSG